MLLQKVRPRNGVIGERRLTPNGQHSLWCQTAKSWPFDHNGHMQRSPGFWWEKKSSSSGLFSSKLSWSMKGSSSSLSLHLCSSVLVCTLYYRMACFLCIYIHHTTNQNHPNNFTNYTALNIKKLQLCGSKNDFDRESKPKFFRNFKKICL